MSLQDAGIKSNGLSPIVAGYSKRLSYFNKKVDKLIDRDEPTQVLMEVTPGMAAEMLQRNRELNRNINERYVSDFAADIKNGRWSVTGQGLSFDTNGKLLDGQHRLQACIDAGVSFTTWVAFGISPESFLHHDRGQNRRNGQLFKMAGLPLGNTLSVSTRFVILFETGNISLSPREHGIVSINHADRPAVEDMISWTQARPEFVNLLVDNGGTYRHLTGLSRSYGHALHWIIRSQYPKKGDTFMERLCLGIDIMRGDPIHRVRMKLERATNEKYQMPSAWRAAFVIKAFNAWNKGTALSILKIGGTESFPKVK